MASDLEAWQGERLLRRGVPAVRRSWRWPVVTGSFSESG